MEEGVGALQQGVEGRCGGALRQEGGRGGAAAMWRDGRSSLLAGAASNYIRLGHWDAAYKVAMQPTIRGVCEGSGMAGGRKLHGS